MNRWVWGISAAIATATVIILCSFGDGDADCIVAVLINGVMGVGCAVMARRSK